MSRLLALPEGHLAEVLVECHEHSTLGQRVTQDSIVVGPRHDLPDRCEVVTVRRAASTASEGTFSLARYFATGHTGSG